MSPNTDFIQIKKQILESGKPATAISLPVADTDQSNTSLLTKYLGEKLLVNFEKADYIDFCINQQNITLLTLQFADNIPVLDFYFKTKEALYKFDIEIKPDVQKCLIYLNRYLHQNLGFQAYPLHQQTSDKNETNLFEINLNLEGKYILEILLFEIPCNTQELFIHLRNQILLRDEFLIKGEIEWEKLKEYLEKIEQNMQNTKLRHRFSISFGELNGFFTRYQKEFDYFTINTIFQHNFFCIHVKNKFEEIYEVKQYLEEVKTVNHFFNELDYKDKLKIRFKDILSGNSQQPKPELLPSQICRKLNQPILYIESTDENGIRYLEQIAYYCAP